MNDDLETISFAYETMRQGQLVRSKAEFSQQWLMQGASYLSSAQARNRRPRKEVLDHLASRLRTSMAGLEKIGTIYSQTLSVRAVAIAEASAIVEMRIATMEL